MTRHILLIIALVSFTLLNSCGITDDREAKAKEYLQQKISDQSGNALKLENFTKTNGVEQDVMGMKMYVLEWTIQTSVQNNVWKAGNPMPGMGFWSDFKTLTKRPENEYLLGKDGPHLAVGTNIRFTGNCKLQKTEQGWRAESYYINSHEIQNKDSAAAK